MKRIVLIVAGALAILAAALPGTAAALNGLPANQPQATCPPPGAGRPQIIVGHPSMSALGNMAFGPDMGIITNPPQDVAYRVTIVRSNGSVYTRGPWRKTRVWGSAGDWWNNTATQAWVNLDTNTSEYTPQPFSINEPGVFYVYVNYYWYAGYFSSAQTAGYLTQISNGTNGSCRFYPEEFQR